MSPRVRRYTYWLLSVFLVASVVYLLAVLFLGRRELTERVGEASVSVYTDRGTLFAPGDCTTIRWHVSGIREVYWDGQPSVGEAEQYVCATRTLPVLTVVFLDGVRREYKPPVSFLIDQPVHVYLLLLTVVALVSLVVVRAAPQQGLEAKPLVSSDAVDNRRMERAAGGCLSIIGGIALASVMSFALLEGVMRFYYSTFGSSEDRIRYLMTADEIARLPRSILPLPGVEYGLTPGFGDISVLGWRGDDVVLPKPQGVFRIVAMGASTTYGFTATEETYPAWLERILHETYGLNNVEVVNAGVSGYTTWNSMVSLATRVLELEPDLVIVYHATNDVLARDVEPECYRGHNPLRGLDPRMYMSGVQLISLSPSVLLRFLDLQTGRVVDPLRIDSILQPPPYECAPGINVANASPQVAHDTERIRANPPVYFERNLRTMIGIARIHNIQFMLPTWAYWEATTEPGVYWREAIAEHNSIIRQLVREYDLLSVDYAETAPQEQEYWSDYIHMNSDGSRHQAQTFADYLVEQDVFGADVSAGAGSG